MSYLVRLWPVGSGQTVTLIRPLGDALNRYVLGGSRVHGDDTLVPVLELGKKRTRQARLWGYVRDDRAAGIDEPPVVWFAYSPDRKGLWPQSHLAKFKGTLQVDGYAGFDALYAKGHVQEATCWVHVRRKFYEIDQVHPNMFAGTVLKHIAELYGIEKEIRGTLVEQRTAARKARAGPILATLKEKLNTVLRSVPRKSPQAKAIHYALKRWVALTVYATDGLIEIDNNPVERQIRPVVLWRKNFLFAGSDSGGESAAMMYGLLSTAKLNGLEDSTPKLD